MEGIDLTSVLTQLGVAVIFVWLFWTERKAHEKTRENYMDDLRAIAGLKQQLGFTRAIVEEAKNQHNE